MEATAAAKMQIGREVLESSSVYIVPGSNKQFYFKDAAGNHKKPPAGAVRLADHHTGCVPCLLKRLITVYWSEYRLRGGPDSAPRSLAWNDPAIWPLHSLGDRWIVESGVSADELRQKLTQQQDSDGYTMNLLEGITHSIRQK